jgi:hypothetical protein
MPTPVPAGGRVRCHVARGGSPYTNREDVTMANKGKSPSASKEPGKDRNGMPGGRDGQAGVGGKRPASKKGKASYGSSGSKSSGGTGSSQGSGGGHGGQHG